MKLLSSRVITTSCKLKPIWNKKLVLTHENGMDQIILALYTYDFAQSWLYVTGNIIKCKLYITLWRCLLTSPFFLFPSERNALLSVNCHSVCLLCTVCRHQQISVLNTNIRIKKNWYMPGFSTFWAIDNLWPKTLPTYYIIEFAIKG